MRACVCATKPQPSGSWLAPGRCGLYSATCCDPMECMLYIIATFLLGGCWYNTHKHSLIQLVLLTLKWQTKKEFLLVELMNLLDTIAVGLGPLCFMASIRCVRLCGFSLVSTVRGLPRSRCLLVNLVRAFNV